MRYWQARLRRSSMGTRYLTFSVNVCVWVCVRGCAYKFDCKSQCACLCTCVHVCFCVWDCEYLRACMCVCACVFVWSEGSIQTVWIREHISERDFDLVCACVWAHRIRCMTDSTENAKSLKSESTRSKNQDFSGSCHCTVQFLSQILDQFEFVPRNLSLAIWWILGV